MAVIVLRDYQDELVDSARKALAIHRRVLLQSPTGSGKTVMFSYIASRARQRGKRIGIFAHRAELLRQISATLRNFDVPHGIIASGASFLPKQQVYVVAAATYARRAEKMPTFDLGIIDEAHHATPGSTWGACMDHSPEAMWLGVSATPERLDGRGLGEIFEELIVGPPVRLLIERGALAAYRLFLPPGVDLTGVHTLAGDYNKGELAAAMDRPAITGDAVRHYSKHLGGAPSVAFCTSVAHAAHVAEEFRAGGFIAAHVDGGMETVERDRIIGDFAAGRMNVLTSCDLVSEGFDVPGIHGAILLRPTQSLALYLQQVGRALRTAPGKDHAVILDHAGNAKSHGLPDADREWSLEGRDRKAKQKPDDPVRQCERCFAAYSARIHTCPECGWAPAANARRVEQVDGELVEVDIEAARVAEKQREETERAERMRERGRARTVPALARLGMSEGQARHIVEAREAKRRLQEELQRLVDDHHRALNVRPLTNMEIMALKPKKLQEWIDSLTLLREPEIVDEPERQATSA